MLEPISIDKTLVEILKLDETQPLSPNFAMLSYGTLYPTRNLGFNCVYYIAFPIGFILCWILRKVFSMCKTQKRLLRKFRDKCLSNGFIIFFGSTYLSTCVSLFLSTSYTKFDTVGNCVNALFSVVIAFVIIFFPIFVGVFYCYNFEKIIREDPKFMSKWGVLIEPLNFKRGGKRVIFLPVLSLVRKLILAATLVFAQDATIFLTIFSLMF
jgi:hypothetical protein